MKPLCHGYIEENDMKTHCVYYIDKFGRRVSQSFTHAAYDKALPELLENGRTLGIQYYVTAGGETRELDYYNVYKSSDL